MMSDLKGPAILYLKAVLLVVAGGIAGGLIVVGDPRPRTALLLAITIWAFARAYYFAFYVIEHYIDPAYRFSGLGSFLCYLLRRRSGGDRPPG